MTVKFVQQAFSKLFAGQAVSLFRGKEDEGEVRSLPEYFTELFHDIIRTVIPKFPHVGSLQRPL